MGQRIVILPAGEESDYVQSAVLLTENNPWAKLGRTYEYSYAKVTEPDGNLIVAKQGDTVVGCLLLEMHSTLKAFVRALCVHESCRGKGIGASLLSYAEHMAFQKTANVFLFVSSERGKKFYEANEYECIGIIRDMNITGTHEYLMRKSIGPGEEITYGGLSVLVLDSDAQTLEDAIRFAGEKMHKHGLVRKAYAEKCIEREKTFSTGLPTPIPVAIPHTDEIYVNRNCLCFQRVKKPVAAIELGGTEPVYCPLVVNMGLTGNGMQVTMLGEMMEVLSDESFVTKCMEGSPEEVEALIQNTLGKLILTQA